MHRTMSAIDGAVIAVRAVKENTGLEVICTFTFEKNLQGEYRSMMGVRPSEAALACIKAGADIVGTNCGNGMAGMVEIVREIRKHVSGYPVLVHANAGLPEHIDGKDVFPETPEHTASLIAAVLDAGAGIVGGCCGTTPLHISAIKKAVESYRQRRGKPSA